MMNNKLTIRPLQSSDYDIIFELCQKRFGEGYLEKKEFESWLKFPEYALAAEYGGSFAGFLCYMPSTVNDIAEYMKITPEYINNVSGGKDVVHFKTAILYPEYEGKGIIHSMAALAQERLKKYGYGAIFGPAWKYGDCIPMKKPLLRLGFSEVCERENIWYDMENYTCVICGGRCRCTAVIFQKKL